MLDFGHEVCGDLHAASGQEWLVTNGIGGYASGTVAGLLTRRYHGLLVAALQLTWMDAKVGDWVVTPRIGKPVEINALWYNALCSLAEFAHWRAKARSLARTCWRPRAG